VRTLTYSINQMNLSAPNHMYVYQSKKAAESTYSFTHVNQTVDEIKNAMKLSRHRWTGRYEAHLWDNSCKKEGQTRKGRQGN